MDDPWYWDSNRSCTTLATLFGMVLAAPFLIWLMKIMLDKM